MVIYKDVEITEDEYDRSIEFGNKVAPTTRYADSNQNDLVKISQDHSFGKAAEFAARRVLNSLSSVVKSGRLLSEPDLAIYNGKRKSWDSDLICESDSKFNVAVKSWRYNERLKDFPISWTFQFDSSGRKDSIFSKEDSLVCFVKHLEGNKYRVYRPVLFSTVRVALKDPISYKLKGKKLCMYEEDLIKLFKPEIGNEARL